MPTAAFLYLETTSCLQIVLITLLGGDFPQVYKRKLDTMRSTRGLQDQARRRFHIPIQQRHVTLLGRSIDFNRVIAHHASEKLSADLELAFKVGRS